jgi:hypothetical protein
MGIGSLAHQRMSPTPGEEDQLIGIEWERLDSTAGVQWA